MALFNTMKNMVDRHYRALAAANCNTCHIGAWVVCRENHLLEKSGGYSMKAFFNRLSGNSKKTVPNSTIVMDNAVCACQQDQQCKILIVCKGEAFSRSVADYAVNMAKKTRSSLVALSLDESGKDFQTFSCQAKDNIKYFSCKAADAGLGFCHEIRQGAQDDVVEQMHASDPQFRYVMDDTAVVRNTRSIPVYTRATLRAK